MTEKQSNQLRWLFIIPGTLGASMLGLSSYLFFCFLMVSSGLHVEFLIFGAPAATAFVWVNTSYYIAPIYRSQIAWVSLVVGTVTVIVLFWGELLMVIPAVLGGLLAVVYLTEASQLLETIKRKIK